MRRGRSSFHSTVALVVGGCLAMSTVGCGGGGNPDPPVPVHDDVDSLRTRLLEVAETGEGGSSLGDLYESAEKLEDKALAAKLQKGLDQIDRAQSVEQRKRLAKQLAESL